MKRYIGTWSKEQEKVPEVAELIIDGNQIEFYRRDSGEIFPCAFVGSDGQHQYKVFTKGCCSAGHNRTLEHTTSYRTFFVLQQNCPFKKGLEISGIKECSFIIPELLEWLEINTIDVTFDDEVQVREYRLSPIVLHDSNPYVEIRFESESFNSISEVDTRTTYIVKNQPRIHILFEEIVDVYTVLDQLEYLMQFWGLMIGSVSNVEDIRLSSSH